MRWLLLLLVVLFLACVEEKKAEPAAPAPPAAPAQPPAVPPAAEQPAAPPVPEEPAPQVQVSVRELLPSTVMDYTNFTFKCGAGFCTGFYKTRLVGNNNSVQVDFYSKSDRYLVKPMSCELQNSRFSDAYKDRTIIWCKTYNTPEKFSSSLWWYEPSLGYVSILSEETTRVFSNATRAKNADLAANNTALYIVGRIDYYLSSGKSFAVGES